MLLEEIKLLELIQFDQITELFTYKYSSFIFCFIEVLTKTESISQIVYN